MTRSIRAQEASPDLERAQALERIKIKRDFGWHLATYLIVNGFLTFIWSLGGGAFWPIWIIVPWGIGLAFHAAYTFLGRPITERDIEREMRTRDPRS
jgi:hypothetical protein